MWDGQKVCLSSSKNLNVGKYATSEDTLSYCLKEHLPSGATKDCRRTIRIYTLYHTSGDRKLHGTLNYGIAFCIMLTPGRSQIIIGFNLELWNSVTYSPQGIYNPPPQWEGFCKTSQQLNLSSVVVPSLYSYLVSSFMTSLYSNLSCLLFKCIEHAYSQCETVSVTGIFLHESVIVAQVLVIETCCHFFEVVVYSVSLKSVVDNVAQRGHRQEHRSQVITLLTFTHGFHDLIHPLSTLPPDKTSFPWPTTCSSPSAQR